ncbi:DUF3656 domain-containing U32 family peptidase [Pectinatus sottacetonis]|uniref:DUF3656 domain-containing U32 family peptidase n=1 Tax=Pectinatus sottacetonis TaxID=1002795 RepID=UPI0018C4ACD1|nr:U32 family peptidase [Pectinatus sottacetonis]
MVELLAPAGTWQSFKAAVESGADAVYLSGKNFGARAFADNFANDDLKRAVDYAHLRNTAVHVTVNILIDNKEIQKLADYLCYLYSIGVDAIIVQDLGVAKIAQTVVPDLPMHASTQMSVNNLETVKMLEELNFRRVVLAREVTLADIQLICANTAIEIETFIHGAICVCYSGQCLMSSMIGGRSGNRGCCAQPCRLPYTLVDKDDNDLLQSAEAGQYLLSPRDMRTIDMIPDLIKAGVKSFKIEGRMKKPEYVTVVVKAYRNKIDSFYNNSISYNKEKTDRELAQIFNRDFTTAYLKNRPGKTMISDKKPNNRGMLIGRVYQYDYSSHLAQIKLSDDLSIGDKIDLWVKVGGRINQNITSMKIGKTAVDTAHKGDIVTIKLPSHVHEHDRVFKVFDMTLAEKTKPFFTSSDPVRRIPLNMKLTAHIGSPVRIDIVDTDNITASFTAEFIAEEALKRPLNYDTIHKQMSRLGNTIYFLAELSCDIDDNVMVPMSILNELRRNVINKIIEKRQQRFLRPKITAPNCKKNFFAHEQHHTGTVPQLFVSVDTIDKLSGAAAHCDGILLGGDSYTGRPLTSDDYRAASRICRDTDTALYLNLPRILRQDQMGYIDSLITHIDIENFSGIYVNTLGQLRKLRTIFAKINKFLPIWTDFSMNVFNNASIAFLKELTIQGVTLSPELNLAQIKNILSFSTLPAEIIVQGNIELMVSEYCIPGSFLGGVDSGSCTAPCKRNNFYLKDRKNEHFPVISDQFCHMHILNGRELVMLAHIPDLSHIGLSRIRIDGRYMNINKLKQTVKIYKEVLKKGKYHPIFQNNSIETIEGSNFTRGHFFRGIILND